MPFKSEEARKEASRKSMEKRRGINGTKVNPGPAVNPVALGDNVNPADALIPSVNPRSPIIREDWRAVHAYLQRPQVGRMSQLERIQRIAGSLGKHAESVRFGVTTGPNFQEIGELIGTQPAFLTK